MKNKRLCKLFCFSENICVFWNFLKDRCERGRAIYFAPEEEAISALTSVKYVKTFTIYRDLVRTFSDIYDGVLCEYN